MSNELRYDVTKIVEDIIQSALEKNASDIHIEPQREYICVRFRIDGVLSVQEKLPVVLVQQLIARIKIMGSIDTAQTRLPQDGNYSIVYKNHDIDLRIATFPALYGEKIVLRILHQSDTVITLDTIGMDQKQLQQFKELIQHPHGFFIVSGPTGAGKTTTLYAALTLLNSPEKNIVTLEDPIEYCLSGITQSQIHSDIGFGFAQGMRALLRQDPDIVLIGEIRDQETTQTALQAALTGHMVLSTIHTVDAPSVVVRLIDMGIEPFLVNAALTGVVAQRLARILCEKCKEQKTVTAEEQVFLQKINASIQTAYYAKGCSECFNTGYKGRVGIFELLVIDEKIRNLLMKNPSIVELRDHAREAGMKPMIQDGLEKLKSGIISLEELMKLFV